MHSYPPQKNESAVSLAKWPLILLAIVLIGFVVYSINHYMTDRYSVHGDRLFKAAFDEDLESIKDLSQGGNISSDYDEWIHFKLAREAKLKDIENYKGDDAKEVARRWFEAKFPENKGVDSSQRPNLKFWSRVDSTSAQLKRQWYMYNWRTDDHFYRIFGM